MDWSCSNSLVGYYPKWVIFSSAAEFSTKLRAMFVRYAYFYESYSR